MKEKIKLPQISATTLLQAVFLVLKLTNTVDWNWWIICSPLLISVGWLLFIFILAIPLAIRKYLDGDFDE